MSVLETLQPWIRRHTRRLLCFALAPGLVSLAFEAYVGHYAGTTKSGASEWQPVPIWFGIGGFVILMALCVMKPAVFRVGVRVVGLASLAVGVAGLGFHVWSFVADIMSKGLFGMQGEEFMDELDTALGVAPPAFAPGAFALMGLMLYALGSRNVLVRLRLPRGDRR